MEETKLDFTNLDKGKIEKGASYVVRGPEHLSEATIVSLRRQLDRLSRDVDARFVFIPENLKVSIDK